MLHYQHYIIHQEGINNNSFVLILLLTKVSALSKAANSDISLYLGCKIIYTFWLK